MDNNEIKQGFDLLVRISNEMTTAVASDDALFELINNLPLTIKEQNIANNAGKQDKPVGACRYIISQKLVAGEQLTAPLIQEIMQAVEAKHKKEVFRAWSIFGICYALYYDQYVKQVNKFLSDLVAQLKADLDYPEAKDTVVDFRGARNFGAERCWFAIYNPSHEKQDTAKQFFLNVGEGKINYGLYYHPTKNYLSEIASVAPQDFNYEDLLNIYKANFNQVVNDDIDVAMPVEPVVASLYPTRYYIGGSIWEGDDQTQAFIDEGYWENGYDNKFQDEINDVPVGAKIAIKSSYAKGSDSILRIKYIGTVKENPQDGKNLIVNWEPSIKQFDISGLGSYRQTFHEITNEDDIEAIFFHQEEKQNVSIESFAVHPLNQIFYGPPGTGKTYNTINHALAILENTTVEAIKADEQRSGRKAINERFENFKQKGFVEFITFHQNYSYEEFVQGLRPALGKDGVEPDTLKFKKVDGIFKRMADEAFKNLVGGEVEEEQELSFNELLAKFLEPLKDGGEIEIDMASAGSKFHIIKEEEKYIVFKNSAGNTAKINKMFLEKAFNLGSYEGIVVGGLISYYAPLLNKLKKLKEETGVQISPIVPHKYVLIIDEINRANISRVFGELITLLEEDKRWDNEHKLKIKLPSGDEFTVPKNLYIIGTMNTADKSIALLDIALRRRFDFIPMYPDATLVKEGYGLFFATLNESIKRERGVDFAIGHSYLMDSTGEKPFDFITAMNKKVIPLLNEYFYSSKEGKVQELIAGALNAGGLGEKFKIELTTLGILSIQSK